MLRANLIARITVDRLHYIVPASKLFDYEKTKPMFSVYIHQCDIFIKDVDVLRDWLFSRHVGKYNI